MMGKIIGMLVFSAILFTGCSDYNKVLKSDDHARKFAMANELYENGDQGSNYERSVNLYQQVYQRSPNSGEGEVSYFRVGKAFYLSGDYYSASYYLGVFVQRFPGSVKVEEATFLSAMCSVNDSPHWSLDQEFTEVAINDLQIFIDRFPNSSLVDSCNNMIDRLRFKIETKTYEGVKLYSKTLNYRASVASARAFMEDYPLSMFKEEVHYLLVKNSYELATFSIDNKKLDRIKETIERYSTFVAAFPDSKYLKELAGYDDKMREERDRINSENK